METKAKKKKAEAVAAKETKVATTIESVPYVGKKTFTFISRDKSAEMKMNSPVKKNNASEVVFQVLGMGDLPIGCRLQWADSYSAHFIAKKGKNACGASSANGLLVVNGIADELEAAGVKGIIQPTKKPFKGIDVKSYSPMELKDLASKIAKVLGFTKSSKAGKPSIPAKVVA